MAAPERGGEWEEWDENRRREAARELIANFDSNGDGRVARSEIPDSMRNFRDVVRDADQDGDGAASLDEVEDFVVRSIEQEWGREEEEDEGGGV